MILMIGAQDIRAISFALAEDGHVAKTADVQAGPEGYLAALDRVLQSWGVSIPEFEAVAVVTGPGAFTSSRVSTIIANTIAFALGRPVIPVQNPERLPLAELAVPLGRPADAARAPFAVPVYDRPPHIT